MPHHKSAEKRMRTNEKARQRNRAVKSQLKGVLKKLDEAGEPDEAAKALQNAVAALDRAARKRVIPKGRADRTKSRLARRTTRRTASSSASSK
jgi:small subunit ribosomal protein S20